MIRFFVVFLAISALNSFSCTYCAESNVYYDYVKNISEGRRNVVKFEQSEALKPEMVLEKFYDIFFVSEDKHTLILLYSAYTTLVKVMGFNDTEEYLINRLCSAREKLLKLKGESKCFSKEIESACKLINDVTMYVPYAGLTLYMYGGIRPKIPCEARKELYYKVLGCSEKFRNSNAVFESFTKFIEVNNPFLGQ